MKIVNTVEQLNAELSNHRQKGIKIGFVPTMGALHAGHLSLVSQAKKKCPVVVCSIFVNPTQFNDKNDLAKYPRTLEKDCQLLQTVACDIVFAPLVEEVYPPNLETKLSLNIGSLTTVLEGEFRPGHFDGMVQVVKRLLDIVQPSHLFMGQKDFQQFTIVQAMINALKLKTKLVVCKTEREKHGLAMSSRNERLLPDHRLRAAIIHKSLLFAKNNLSTLPINKIEQQAIKMLDIQDFKLEYFKIVDGSTLQPVTQVDDHKYIVALVAIWAGEVRLIDNLILKKQGE